MRRLTAWIGGAVGAITAYRWLRRRPQTEPEPAPAEPDERAEALRARLAESRVAEPVVEQTPPEPAVEEGEPTIEEESPDDRRRRVHEEGRAALDEMQSDS